MIVFICINECSALAGLSANRCYVSMSIHGDNLFCVGFATGANNAGKFVFRLVLRPISVVGSHPSPAGSERSGTNSGQTIASRWQGAARLAGRCRQESPELSEEGPAQKVGIPKFSSSRTLAPAALSVPQAATVQVAPIPGGYGHPVPRLRPQKDRLRSESPAERCPAAPGWPTPGKESAPSAEQARVEKRPAYVFLSSCKMIQRSIMKRAKKRCRSLCVTAGKHKQMICHIEPLY